MLHSLAQVLAAAALQDAAAPTSPAAPAPVPAVFAPAVLIEAAGAPINADDDILFPSPVLLDVDADGADELVVGDLWGHLYVHERVAVEGSAERVWGARSELRHADGSNVQLPNW
jgi:hypothetical protein